MARNRVPASVWRQPVHFVAAGFGLGAMPYAPGTFGTLAGIPFVLALAGLPWWGQVLACLLLFAVGIPLCERTARDWGEHDHGGIVWDEVVGLCLTMVAVPVSMATVVAGFVLFRFFDVLKPWPIRLADQHVHGGLGIMLDDVLAAVFAAGCLHALLWAGWLLP